MVICSHIIKRNYIHWRTSKVLTILRQFC